MTCSALAQAVKDREGAVRQDRATMENDARWIYNDYRKGLAEAKRTGKPLLVVLRCVPCHSCAGIDAAVLEQAEKELAPLLDKFICVRVINANDLDLSLFQFDYDLSFSTIIFNGDGTIYGRYGSWTHQHEFQNTTITGYQRALEGALAIHRGYPANKASLAGKQGGPMPFKTPVEIPALASKYKSDLDWEGKVVPSCVHCHQIGDAFRASFRDRKKAIPTEWIYPWPSPETIGLTLASDEVGRVTAVAVGSIAAKAGVQSGDDLVTVAGQPLISIADVSWALHRAPDAGALAVEIKRGGSKKTLSLALPANWRANSEISKRVGTWPMRGMALGGLVLEEAPDATRTQHALGKDRLALRVKGLGQYGKNAAAKNAGFQKEDVLVEIDGKSDRMTESALIGKLLQTHQPGEKIKATVLRGQQRVELSLPMQ
jgi:serine protease Do